VTNKTYPTGRQCRCTVCGRTFSTDTNFRTHRIGDFQRENQPNNRTCMTIAELGEIGLVESGGIWRAEPPVTGRFWQRQT